MRKTGGVTKRTGSAAINTNLIFLFMVFTFAIMFITPLIYLLRIQFTGVSALIALIVMAMIGTAMIFFVTKRQEEAHAITFAAVIFAEIVFVIIFIMFIASLI
ncbi:MAG: hypothetical protein GF353_28555 [Candidatus Lokiarchaeota archaeon]|nr:hypothetical protein [Candidatus Lokiarchaeota archaeon]MBD3353954.1 hypothetical protein [Candidatus Lokiarchaeota archaeon]